MRVLVALSALVWTVSASDNGVSITFANRQAFAVDLLWADGISDPVKMSSIDADEEIIINSYPGHQFIFAHPGSTEALFKHTIDAERTVYELPAEMNIPPPPKPPKPRSLLPTYTLEELAALRETEQTTNDEMVENFANIVPVKFRNLAGREIEIWYDSGSGSGVKHGVMAPGDDSTTNSYLRSDAESGFAGVISRAGAFKRPLASPPRSHVFCFVEVSEARGCERALAKVTVSKETYTYTFDDGTGSELVYKQYADEKEFVERYRKSTQRPWITLWPREVRASWSAGRTARARATQRLNRSECDFRARAAPRPLRSAASHPCSSLGWLSTSVMFTKSRRRRHAPNACPKGRLSFGARTRSENASWPRRQAPIVWTLRRCASHSARCRYRRAST